MFSCYEDLWPADSAGSPQLHSARHEEAARHGPSSEARGCTPERCGGREQQAVGLEGHASLIGAHEDPRHPHGPQCSPTGSIRRSGGRRAGQQQAPIVALGRGLRAEAGPDPVRETAALDWSSIDPLHLGYVIRARPRPRSALAARRALHGPRKIMRIVNPVVSVWIGGIQRMRRNRVAVGRRSDRLFGPLPLLTPSEQGQPLVRHLPCLNGGHSGSHSLAVELTGISLNPLR